MKKICLLVFTSILTLATGCSSVPVDEKDPASLFKDAQSEIESDHYQIAIDKLQAIKNKFPYSNFAAESQLRIADVYFIEDLFAEAAANYQIFKDLHPKHAKVAYAMFRIGKSYLQDAPTLLERDLSPLKKALEAYQDFLNRFSESPEAVEARKDVVNIRKRLAEKELLIGDFYFRREIYLSAQSRYEKILQLYPDTDEAKVADSKLTETKKKIDAAEGSKKYGTQ